MKYAIFSDIHSNIQAFETAYNLVKDNVDKILCLGDIVGYNANPKKCLNLSKKIFSKCVKGNHDEIVGKNGASNIVKMRYLSRDAQDGVIYSISQLNKEDKKWLNNLSTEEIIENKFMITHALKNNLFENFPYILNSLDAKWASLTMESKGLKKVFLGHTHFPTFYKRKGNAEEYIMDTNLNGSLLNSEIKLDNEHIYIINPGAIGQTRGIMMPSYIIYNSDNMVVEYKAFEYDNYAAYNAVIDAQYSMRIAKRLL